MGMNNTPNNRQSQPRTFFSPRCLCRKSGKVLKQLLFIRFADARALILDLYTPTFLVTQSPNYYGTPGRGIFHGIADEIINGLM